MSSGSQGRVSARESTAHGKLIPKLFMLYQRCVNITSITVATAKITKIIIFGQMSAKELPKFQNTFRSVKRNVGQSAHDILQFGVTITESAPTILVMENL